MEKLYEFEEDHLRYIQDEIPDATSPLYSVAYNSLTTSVSWVQQIVRYIDDTYKEYTESKFDASRAWHITTRLAKVLLEIIAEPRTGILRSLKAKNPKQMKRSTFFSTTKSLETMKKLSHIGFKNSPVVAGELVKFLAKNTQVESIEKLKREVKELTEANKRLRGALKSVWDDAAEAKKTANRENNKADDANKAVANLKRALDALDTRVKKLE